MPMSDDTERKKKSKSKSKSKVKFDYNSKNGFITKTWGPALWLVLHIISMNFDPSRDSPEDYMQFILLLTKVLPCGACRKNLVHNLKATNFGPHVFKSRSTFSRYIYKLHKHINTMLGKETPMTYKEVRNVYEHFRAKCEKTSKEEISITGKPVKEKGCVDPAYNIKSKCILSIVPQTMETHSSIIIHPECLPFLNQ